MRHTTQEKLGQYQVQFHAQNEDVQDIQIIQTEHELNQLISKNHSDSMHGIIELLFILIIINIDFFAVVYIRDIGFVA